jgi:RNase P subunit RPR2
MSVIDTRPARHTREEIEAIGKRNAADAYLSNGRATRLIQRAARQVCDNCGHIGLGATNDGAGRLVFACRQCGEMGDVE